MDSKKNTTYGPISEPVFYILVSLLAGEKHGYAILKDVDSLSQSAVQLSTSTLYTALGRLEEHGCIERIPDGSNPTPGLPRKVYRLTNKGRELLHIEANRLTHLARLVSSFRAA